MAKCWKNEKQELDEWAREKVTESMKQKQWHTCDSCGYEDVAGFLNFTGGLFGDSAECPRCGGAMIEVPDSFEPDD